MAEYVWIYFKTNDIISELGLELFCFFFSFQVQETTQVQMSTAAPYRPLTDAPPPCLSRSLRTATKQTGKPPTATWQTTTRTPRTALTRDQSKTRPRTRAPTGRRRPGPCSAAVRCFSWSLPSTWNGTWAARRERGWLRPCTWQRLRSRSGSRTGGINGRDSWRRTSRLRTSHTRVSELSGSPFCITRDLHPLQLWVSTWPDIQFLHPSRASPAPSITPCRRLLTPWACWDRRWPAWCKDCWTLMYQNVG